MELEFVFVKRNVDDEEGEVLYYLDLCTNVCGGKKGKCPIVLAESVPVLIQLVL